MHQRPQKPSLIPFRCYNIIPAAISTSEEPSATPFSLYLSIYLSPSTSLFRHFSLPSSIVGQIRGCLHYSLSGQSNQISNQRLEHRICQSSPKGESKKDPEQGKKNHVLRCLRSRSSLISCLRETLLRSLQLLRHRSRGTSLSLTSSLSLRPLTLPLQVSVPCSSLFKTVTVRCGHCTNLLSVNMRALLLPTANQYSDSFLIPPHSNLLVRSRLLIVLVLKVFKVSERTGRALTSPSAVASGAASDCTKPDDSAAEGNAGDEPDPDG